MKSTGITRPIDDLGRFVIPKELRRSFELNNNDKARLVFQCDVRNNVTTLINYEFDESLHANVPKSWVLKC